MKKTLIRTAKPRFGFKPLSFRARLGGSLVVLTLVTGIGLAASRPAHTAGGPVSVSVANTPLPTVPTDEAAPRQPFQMRTRYVILTGQVSGTLNTANGWSSRPSPWASRQTEIQ